MKEKVAVLYRTGVPPARGHSKKSVKLEKFKGSSADIAWNLAMRGISVVTPRDYPADKQDLDWIFPDTDVGIQRAYDLGARVFWLNTDLHEGHAIDRWLEVDVKFVGHTPQAMSSGEDKFETNKKLRASGLDVAVSRLVTNVRESSEVFPVVIKPVRGFGSKGVSVVHSIDELHERIKELNDAGEYGPEFILEEMLPGEEISVLVMPPGKFFINGDSITKDNYWALPPVLRFNHKDGIAPCADDLIETENSCVLTADDISCKEIRAIITECETAAREIGWSYSDLLLAIFSTRWHSL